MVYRVGGSVRDELLGLPVQDRDYVVVGATPAEMIERGFKAVGSDFPVFLHPETHEEYALARTERKMSRGYKGFSFHAAPDVTLEDDLARRDLTINAIAQDERGRIIDPFGGAADLRAGVLRHVSPAFLEDPVRVLRVARFAARFGFRVAPETAALMREMVANGEVDALVPERVWQEIAKGLMEAAPRRMFEVLAESGALVRVLPEWAELDSERALRALTIAAERGLALPARYAALFAGGDAKVAEHAASRLRAPSNCRELALLAAETSERVREARALDAGALVDLLQRADAFRRPDRFAALVEVCECDAGAIGEVDAQRASHLLSVLVVARGVDAGAIAQANPSHPARAVRAARIAAVAAAFGQ
jgi:tRNA nucleotidyltransferase (CCA-adding enzyme)